jgi:hypothetical protein
MFYRGILRIQFIPSEFFLKKSQSIERWQHSNKSLKDLSYAAGQRSRISIENQLLKIKRPYRKSPDLTLFKPGEEL